MPAIKVNDIMMNYTDSGRGESLLLIHGLGSSLRDWEEQIPYFSKKYRVFAVDLRGHGASGKPKGPYSIRQFADDVACFMHEVSTGPSHVLGLSMGAATAWHLALDHPGLVRSLVITNMAAAVPVKTFQQKKEYYSRVIIINLLGMKKLGEVIAPKLFPGDENAVWRERMAVRWAENDKKAYLASLRALKNWSVMERLAAINCPVSVIAGDLDYSPLEHKKEYTKLMPHAKLTVVGDARHGLPMEKPVDFNRIVDEFLSGLAGKA